MYHSRVNTGAAKRKKANWYTQNQKDHLIIVLTAAVFTLF